MQNRRQLLVVSIGTGLLVLLVTFTLVLTQTEARGLSTSTLTTNSSTAISIANGQPKDQLASDIAKNTLTDADLILAQVAEMTRKQEDALANQTGWLHLKSLIMIADQMTGDSYRVGEEGETLPMAALTPENSVFETWYLIDETGVYSQGMGLVSSQDGAIHQQTILVDGKWINLTLKAAGAYRQQYETVAPSSMSSLLPDTHIFQSLKESQQWKNTSWIAYSENGRFIVLAEQKYDPPIDNALGSPEPVVATREVFTYNEETGRLISREAQLLPQNSTWLTSEREEYFATEVTPVLPEGTQSLFNDAIQTLSKEN